MAATAMVEVLAVILAREAKDNQGRINVPLIGIELATIGRRAVALAN